MNRGLVLGLSLASLLTADERTRKLAERLPQEAALFAREATKYASEETLNQRSLRTNATPPNMWKEKQVVSRYGFISFKETPEALREMRQIELIDGKKAKSENSLRSVVTTVTAANDKQKRKLLDEFEKAGLDSVATNMGQLLLVFNARQIQSYDFSFQSQRFVGTDRIMIFTYSQVEGGGMTTYRGTDTMRSKLSGEIWVDGDYRPLKVTVTSVAETKDKKLIRQEMEVLYAPSIYPCLLPTKARHRELQDGVLHTETVYEYGPFRPWEQAAK